MTSEGQNRNKIKRKRDFFSHFRAGRAVEEENQFLGEKLQLLSRFPGFQTFGSRRLRSKVFLCGKGYVWASVCGVSKTPRGRGLFLLGYFRF